MMSPPFAGYTMDGFEITRPRTLKRPRARKLFTLQQANRALPLVRRVVTDIVTQYREMERLLRQRRRLERRRHREGVVTFDQMAAEGAARLNELIDEVAAIGCELKDWERGLVDFRSLREGREVYLCWKLGEDAVQHWHEINAGAAGRRQIDGAFA